MTLLFFALAVSAQIPCSPASATVTSIEAINEAPERWLDRCVALDALVTFRTAYARRASPYRLQSSNRAGPGADRVRIGLRGDPAATGAARDLLLPGRVTGRVDTCERTAERLRQETERRRSETGAPVILIVPGGYCHHRKGPVIDLTHVALASEPVRRLTGEANRGFSDLQRMPPDWPERRVVEETASAFAQSVRNGDRRGVTSLLGGDGGDGDAAYVLDTIPSPFAALRDDRVLETALFIDRDEPGGGVWMDDGHRGFSAVICYCRSGRCRDRWPLAAFDADAAPDRPYACLTVRRGAWRNAKLELAFRTKAWLPEPP